jgi:hypothetical protein
MGKPLSLLGLDSFLLLVLVTAHLWFNPVSSAFVVIGLAVYVALDLFVANEAAFSARQQKWLFMFRLLIVWFVVLVAAILPVGLGIVGRRVDGPATHAHDGLIQTEEAIKFLLSGRNPYTEDYTQTPMADFPGQEPPLTDAPLYHNAYLPFLFIGSAPFYLLSERLIGWYDQRFVYLLAYFGALLLLPQLIERRRDGLAAIIAFGLNFLGTFYLADGRNDIVIFFGFLLVTVLLQKRAVGLASFVLGLTMATKHQAWFFLPFYVLYLLPRYPITIPALRRLGVQLMPLIVALALVIGPFLIWDAGSFIDDTVTYISGSGPDSFPMKGWGFSTLLLTAGLVSDAEAAFPFTFFGLVFGLPVLALMLRRQWRDNHLQNAWLGYVAFSFVFQFFSRFFSDNYVVFLLQILVTIAFLKPQYYREEASGWEGLRAGVALGEAGATEEAFVNYPE